MCQPKPGPRCASHLRDALTRARAQARENREAFTHDGHVPHPGIEGRILALLDEYDETPTGQQELQEQIDNADPHLYDDVEIDILRQRLSSGRQRHERKAAALRSTQAGDHHAARMQLRYGSGAAWLATSRLPSQAREAGEDLHVFDGYATAVISTRHSLHHTPTQAPVHTYASTVAYEAPVQPGPQPGTWLIAPSSDGPTLILDEHHLTITPNPDGSGATPAPQHLHDEAALRLLDPHDAHHLQRFARHGRLELTETRMHLHTTVPTPHLRLDLDVITASHRTPA